MTMLSGYRWTFEKRLSDGARYSSKERFDEEVKPWVTRADKERAELFEPKLHRYFMVEARKAGRGGLIPDLADWLESELEPLSQ